MTRVLHLPTEASLDWFRESPWRLTPRLFAVALLVTAALEIAPMAIGRESPAQESVRVLFITIDTLRADRVGAYREPGEPSLTPALDRLAAEGVLFENAFTPMPTTIPAHAAMLFGTWPRVLEVTSNYRRIRPGGAAYLPELFWERGYATAAFLSTDHMGRALGGFPGFDAMNYPADEFAADVTLRNAARWLERNGSRPWFLWVHLWDPHAPYTSHPELNGPAVESEVRQRNGFGAGRLSEGDARTMARLYDGEVAFVDHHLGRFLQSVRRRTDWERTLVIVTADHGETLGEILDEHGYGFDHGEFLREEQVRVPMMIRLPGGEGAGTRVTSTTSHVDLMPTILESVGLPIPPSVGGSSLVPLLSSDATPRHAAHAFLQRKVFRRPPFPFLANPIFAIATDRYLLRFDADREHGQLLVDGRPVVIGEEERDEESRLIDHLRRWIGVTESGDRYADEWVSSDEAGRLRALGYIQ